MVWKMRLSKYKPMKTYQWCTLTTKIVLLYSATFYKLFFITAAVATAVNAAQQ